jgi:hypothetical protein
MIISMDVNQVWCVNSNAKTPVAKEDIGKFYCGDCYIVLYTYHSGEKKEEFYLTTWIGKESAQVKIFDSLHKFYAII